MNIVLLSICGMVLVIFYIRFLESRMIFLPNRENAGNPKDIGLEYENVMLESQDKTVLHGWFVPTAEVSDLRPTMVFLHGNAGNITHRLEKIRIFHDMGMNVFIIDYRGYGRSIGKPTEDGMYWDAIAAFDYIAGRNDINKDKILVYGVSLGGAAAVEVALKRPIAGLILDSAFTSIGDMALRQLKIIPPFLIKTKMASIQKINAIKVPKLFIHSPYDEVVPYSMGLALFEKAQHPKEFLKITGSHSEGFYDSKATVLGGIRLFLRKYFKEDVYDKSVL